MLFSADASEHKFAETRGVTTIQSEDSIRKHWVAEM